MLWNIVNSLSYGNNHLFLKGEESCHITQVLIKVKSLEYAQFMRHTFKSRIWILKMKEICCCYLSFISKSCSGGAGKRPQKRRPAVLTVSELCGFSLNRHISFCTLSTRRVLWWSLDYLLEWAFPVGFPKPFPFYPLYWMHLQSQNESFVCVCGGGGWTFSVCFSVVNWGKPGSSCHHYSPRFVFKTIGEREGIRGAFPLVTFANLNE